MARRRRRLAELGWEWNGRKGTVNVGREREGGRVKIAGAEGSHRFSYFVDSGISS